MAREGFEAVREQVEQLRADSRAQAGEAANIVVSIFVAALVAAYLLPMAITEIVAVDTSSWTGGAGELWAIIPVMIVLAIFIFFVNMALQRSGRL